MERAPGTIVDGRYRLGREIARGGMSVVYEAEHVFTGRLVAMKLLGADRADHPELRARLMREARALTLARHPSVVHVLDAGGKDGEAVYLVMEMIEGRGLDGILTARKRLSVRDAATVGIHLCQALSQAHACGLVHRDIKPSNVIVVRDEEGRESIKVIDFGIAALRDEKRAEVDRKLTRQDVLLGTPEYMSPEQLTMSQDIGHRSDIYSIGVTVFECLTGNVPFAGSYADVLLAATSSAVPDVRTLRPEVPDAVAGALARAMERDPQKRFPVASAFARALAAGLEESGGTGLLGPPPQSSAPVSEFVDEPTRRVARGPELDDEGDDDGAKTPAIITASSGPERAHRRAPYVTPLRLQNSEGELIGGRTQDISEGGLLVMLQRPCWDGDPAVATFAPPGLAAMRLGVTVRWVQAGRGGVAAGLGFRELPDDVRSAIRRYVAGPHDQAARASRAVSGQIGG